MNYKQKTVNGLIWSFTDNISSQGIQFIVGIVLARILSPHEFGLIGMLTIFIAISQSFIDSGFSQALIRRNNCSAQDYSTVFIFNMVVSLVCCFLLILIAPYISSFFNEPQLNSLLKILSLGLILNALSLIQRTILTKELNFKLQTKISVIASLLSGIVAIIMAYFGYGVWSLVALTLCRYGLTTILFFLWLKWKPVLKFSSKSFKDLFAFGSKLLISGLIDTIYRNIYYVIIGKYFSTNDLGYYTRADQFQSMSSTNIQGVISRVSYPVLASMQDNLVNLKIAYKKLIKYTMFITFILLIGMAAVAKPLVIVLIGEKWLPSVTYLQMLCFIGMLYPLQALNLNMLNVQGRSDLFLRLEVIKKMLAIPAIIIGIFFGIKIMIVGMMINSVIAYFLNSHWSGKLLNYSSFEQLGDILPSFILALIIGVLVFLIDFYLNISPGIILFLQISLGFILMIALCEITKFKDYLYLKSIFVERIKEVRNGKIR
jgi:O-antigen/teichoic acid export membrane protein